MSLKIDSSRAPPVPPDRHTHTDIKRTDTCGCSVTHVSPKFPALSALSPWILPSYLMPYGYKMVTGAPGIRFTQKTTKIRKSQTSDPYDLGLFIWDQDCVLLPSQIPLLFLWTKLCCLVYGEIWSAATEWEERGARLWMVHETKGGQGLKVNWPWQCFAASM